MIAMHMMMLVLMLNADADSPIPSWEVRSVELAGLSRKAYRATF
jgi:hypothetical protein